MALAWRSERKYCLRLAASAISASGRPARFTNSSSPASGSSISSALARSRGRRGADGLDHQVDLGDRHPEAFDDLALRLGLAELEARPPRDDLAAVLDEDHQRLLEVEHLGPAVDDREVDDAERRLHVGEAVELVQHDLREDVFFSSTTRRMPSRSLSSRTSEMPSMRLSLHELGDLRVQPRLVDLVGELGDDDLLAVGLAGDLLDDGARAHHDAAAAGPVGLLDARAAVDDTARREIRPRDELA